MRISGPKKKKPKLKKKQEFVPILTCSMYTHKICLTTARRNTSEIVCDTLLGKFGMLKRLLNVSFTGFQ